jgi:tetracycline resistance efflux pump
MTSPAPPPPRLRLVLGALPLLLTPAVAWLGAESDWRSLWPAAVALLTILFLRHAAAGLACGVLAGAWLLAPYDPAGLPRRLLADHLFPSLQGTWKVAAILFTLLLGAFAAILERSGGFHRLLRALLHGSQTGHRRLLTATWGLGLLCFFDGLASNLLSGRITRPMSDRCGVSREKLAWVVDSTGSPIACVAFLSTWIATQLSLIEQGLQGAPFTVQPYALYFASIPANPYCLLTLLLVPLVIWHGWEPAAMRKFQARSLPASPTAGAPPEEIPIGPEAPLRCVLLPLAALALGMLAGFPLLSSQAHDLLSTTGWSTAISGDGGPYALVFGSLCGLAAAALCYPRQRLAEIAPTAGHGAAALLPALLILILAWTLGGVFKSLGAADTLASLLGQGAAASWLPALVFLTGSAMAFLTGSSWGTMGLLTPLALPATLLAGQQAGMPPDQIATLSAMVIGAVFGGATLGDHCSPFSDTTIVSALASGCRTEDHVSSQLPFAALTAAAALTAYSLMALGLPAAAATSLAALFLTVFILSRKRPHA